LGLGVGYDAEQGLLVHGQQSYALAAKQAESCAIDVASLQSKLANWGYAVPISGVVDSATKRVLLAFNTPYMHRWEDSATDETCAVLDSLIAWRDLSHGQMDQTGGLVVPQTARD
jgi:N-acetyl-anhydromuramyl-L-alanine amidase AmpD